MQTGTTDATARPDLRRARRPDPRHRRPALPGLRPSRPGATRRSRYLASARRPAGHADRPSTPTARSRTSRSPAHAGEVARQGALGITSSPAARDEVTQRIRSRRSRSASSARSTRPRSSCAALRRPHHQPRQPARSPGPVGIVERHRRGPSDAAAGLPGLAHRPAVGQPGGRQRAAVPAARRRPRRRWRSSRRVAATASAPAAERAVYLTGFVLLMALLVWVTLFDTGILQRTDRLAMVDQPSGAAPGVAVIEGEPHLPGRRRRRPSTSAACRSARAIPSSSSR